MNLFKSKNRNITQLQKLISKKSNTKLKALCEDMEFKGFHNKSKDDLIKLLLTEPKKLNTLVNRNWWVKYHNHVYFIITVLLAFALVIWGPDIKEYYDNNAKTETLVQNINEDVAKYELLMFPSKNFFDKWKEDYNFEIGRPQYARNSQTDQLINNWTIKKEGTWYPHLDENDKRGITFPNNITDKTFLFDSAYQNKYNFKLITHREAESIGFFSDYVAARKSNIYEKKAIFKEISSDSTQRSQFKQKISEKSYFFDFEGYNIDLIATTHSKNNRRNKYIFDYGIERNRNRISAFFNIDYNICFRVIDDNSDIFMLKLTGQFKSKLLYLNFRYNPKKNILAIEINESGFITAEFNEIKFKGNNPRNLFRIGNSVVAPFYGLDFTLRYLEFNIINNLPNSNLQMITTQTRFDWDESTKLIDSSNRIIGTENKIDSTDFYIQ
jgi:hypothetical protein